MIAKKIEGSITNTCLLKIRLNSRGYEWDDTWVLIRNYGLTMLYLPFKSINSATSISVSNLKD